MSLTHREIEDFVRTIEAKVPQVRPIREALEWHPLSELKENPPDGWVELRGPSVPPAIVHTTFRHPDGYRGYTHFRRALPGPEGCV